MKKIHRKLDKNEHPIFLEEFHEHLTTIDFRGGMIYHYYDPKEEQNRKMISVHKIKPREGDQDAEMLAKKQFKKEFSQTSYDLKTNEFAFFLDIKRGTNQDKTANELSAELKAMLDILDRTGIKTGNYNGFGKITRVQIKIVLALLSKTKNEALMYISDESDEISVGIKSGILKFLKKGMHQVGQTGYFLDREGYMHPEDDFEVNFDNECSLKLTSGNLQEIAFELNEGEVESLRKYVLENEIVL